MDKTIVYPTGVAGNGAPTPQWNPTSTQRSIADLAEEAAARLEVVYVSLRRFCHGPKVAEPVDRGKVVGAEASLLRAISIISDIDERLDYLFRRIGKL